MNKYVKILGVAAVVGVVALVGVAAVFAQPPAPTQTPGGFGPGMMGGYGRMGGGSGPGWMGGGFGLMAEYRDLIHTQIAEALGLTLDELNAELAAGKTPFVIAQEKGIDFAKVQEAMQAAHAEALKQAVEDGKLTQEQADWMLARQAQMRAWQASGERPFGPGMMGRGFGAGGGFAGCPHFSAPPAPES